MRTSRPYMYPAALRKRLAGTGDIGSLSLRVGTVDSPEAQDAHKFI